MVLAGDGQVSCVHAVLERLAGVWTVRDLGSRNGMYVNGRRVLVRLGSQDEITVGDSRLVLRVRRREPDPEVTRSQAPPPQLTPRERDVVLALFAPRNDADPFTTAPATTRQVASALWVGDDDVRRSSGPRRGNGPRTPGS